MDYRQQVNRAPVTKRWASSLIVLCLQVQQVSTSVMEGSTFTKTLGRQIARLNFFLLLFRITFQKTSRLRQAHGIHLHGEEREKKKKEVKRLSTWNSHTQPRRYSSGW